MRALIITCSVLFLSSCTPVDQVGPTPPVEQGLYGVVEFWEGDFMPMALEGGYSGKVTPVQRTLYIHEAASIRDISSPEPAFYDSISTPLIATVDSDSNGEFAVELLPGLYSIFVREGDYFYANTTDGQGILGPAEVIEGQPTYVKVEILYKASF